MLYSSKKYSLLQKMSGLDFPETLKGLYGWSAGTSSYFDLTNDKKGAIGCFNTEMKG